MLQQINLEPLEMRELNICRFPPAILKLDLPPFLSNKTPTDPKAICHVPVLRCSIYPSSGGQETLVKDPVQQ